MRVMTPQPFFFESGKRAVLLLHGFTGHTGDVRMLGRYLEKRHYTCYAPLYKGHGTSPEQLLKTGPENWWEDVLSGYYFLKERGYEEIAVAGLSLGGVFSLKLGYTVPVKGIIPMCTPMYIKNEQAMKQGIFRFAREYKHQEGKSAEQIEQEIATIQPLNTLTLLQNLIADVRNHVDLIYAPTFVVQGRLDTMIDLNSAEIIYREVESTIKDLKWYEQSGHAITLDKERDMLFEDIFQFLEKLNWQQ